MKLNKFIGFCYLLLLRGMFMEKLIFLFFLVLPFTAILGNTEELGTISNNQNDWRVSPPSDKGINRAVLEELHNELKNGDHGYIDSFLVIKGGDIVFERYYDVNYQSLTKSSKLEQASIMRKNYGDLATAQYNYHDTDWHPFYQETELHTIQSVTKSVTSALFGVAIGRGEITDLDSKIVDYFPQYQSLFQDPVKRIITIRNLLTMASGIEWDEFTHLYTDPRNDAASMESSDDWLKFILSPPMEYQPGEKFVYNSGITILLSHILQSSVNMPVDEYAKRFLFEPLGIENFFWKKTPTGITDTESGLYLTSRDFAKIGLLYLNDGMWKKKQILPDGWVELTMTPAKDTGYQNNKYGFQWWLAPYDGGDGKWMYSGSGYGGQYLLVIPEYDLVMVFNGWNIFDVARPAKEYLAKRVLEGVSSDKGAK